ncbi:hypothetical protein [Ruegeria arenilitoris]|uniref:hypothetical protein n=1 Tax=Ruegeria arenilitoris TaxID=1173585 RepID=UPI001481C5FA|nr:hypothetical protein [Ruegeria arenilitoris]
MKYAFALGLLALTFAIPASSAFAECYFGTDSVTGMDTIICEKDDGYSSWGTMLAQA